MEENKNFSELTLHCEEDVQVANDSEVKTTKQCNISSEEIDKETINKLRGDAIGDTMYSQSSVIRLLLQLSDVNWNSKLEEDLCYLWDMTVEKDVCEYLFQLLFPSVATAVLTRYNEPRLLEIIIGILGNICSNSEVKPDISDNEIRIVLSELDTDDHLTLIQIMRFIIAVAYHKNKLPFITPEIIDQICFILTNSTNKELLLCSMDALAKITSDFKTGKECLNVNIISSALIAYNHIKKKDTQEKDEYEEDIFQKTKSSTSFIQIILNMCCYLDEITNNDFHKDMTSKNKELLVEFKTIIGDISGDYEEFDASNEDVMFYFESFTIIFPVLGIGYDKDIFTSVINIIKVLKQTKIDKLDEFIELMRYVISVSDVNTLLKDNENVDWDILQFILEHASPSDFNYKKNLTILIQKLREKDK